MMTISQAVREAIQQNLSGAVAGELATFIEGARATAETARNLQDRLTGKVAELADVSGRLAVAETELKKHRALTDRELAVSARERAIELELMKLRAEQAELRSRDIKELAALAFGHPSFSHTISGQTPVLVPHGGGYASTQSYNHSDHVQGGKHLGGVDIRS